MPSPVPVAKSVLPAAPSVGVAQPWQSTNPRAVTAPPRPSPVTVFVTFASPTSGVVTETGPSVGVEGAERRPISAADQLLSSALPTVQENFTPPVTPCCGPRRVIPATRIGVTEKRFQVPSAAAPSGVVMPRPVLVAPLACVNRPIWTSLGVPEPVRAVCPPGPLPCDTAVASTGAVVSTPAYRNSETLGDASAEFTSRNRRPGTCSGFVNDQNSVRVADPVTARSRVSARSPYVNDAVETPAGCEIPTIQVWFGFGLLGGSHEVDSPAGNRRYWVRPSSSTSARAGAAVHSMTAAPKAAASDRTLTARRYSGLMGASTDSRLGDPRCARTGALATIGACD